MSFNKATYGTLSTLILIAILYFMYANDLPRQQTVGAIGAGYFPKLLSIVLLILCIISFFQTMKKADKKIPIPNIKLMLITLGITIIYLISWRLLGLFYLNTFLYLFILLLLYKSSKIHIWIHILIALITTSFIYMMFEKLLYIRF